MRIIDLRKQKFVLAEITNPGGIGVDPVGLKNIAGTTIDPATEPKQDSIITLLTSIDGKDFSTETTLSALLAAFTAEDFATEVTLDAIKSTTDQLTFNVTSDLLVSLDGETVAISAVSLPLPTGAATEAKQDSQITLLTSLDGKDFATETTLLTRLSKSDFEARINTQGQKTMAASTPVVIASDQSAIPITGSFSSGPIQFVKDTVDTEVELDTSTPANNEPLPTNLYNEDGERGQGKNAIEVERKADTDDNTTVSAATVSTLIVSSNDDRVQVIITNNSNKRMWLKFTSPATTDTARFLDKDDSWIINSWNGDIYGIWDTGATGNCSIEELDNA